MSYQFARTIKFRAIIIIRIGPIRYYYASKIRLEILVPFHLKLARKRG